jgi:HK97 family phage portal protein
VTSDSGSKVIGFDKMLHLRGMSPDGLKGQGPLTLSANLIGLAQALEENASRFFSNGSRPGMVYTAAPGVNLTEQQRNALKDQLNSAYQGVDNFFRTMVLEGGGKMEMTRTANDSSQFDEIAKRTHQHICQVFGVPPHKVGILDNATFSNIEQQQIQAVQDLFLPWCKRWEEAFAGALLLPGEQDNHYWKHNLNGLLRGDAAARFSAYSTGLQNGIYSINEVRGYEDLDPIDGGDTHVRQMNMADILATAVAPARMETAV